MLTAIEENVGISFPLEDFVLSQPFVEAAQAADSAQYFGVEPVLNLNCHHIAVQNETIHWQLWIEDGVRPLVRKVVITFKEAPGSPNFTAIFHQWDLTTALEDFVFEFTPPRGAIEIEMLQNATK